MMWFRQMAQLSTTMSQAQRDTAFHYPTLVNTAPREEGGPRPYLLHLKLLLALDALAVGSVDLLGYWRIAHLDVGHDVAGGSRKGGMGGRRLRNAGNGVSTVRQGWTREILAVRKRITLGDTQAGGGERMRLTSVVAVEESGGARWLNVCLCVPGGVRKLEHGEGRLAQQLVQPWWVRG